MYLIATLGSVHKKFDFWTGPWAPWHSFNKHLIQAQVYIKELKKNNIAMFQQESMSTSNTTLRAVGFSYAKRERNHCEQPSTFPSSMREFGAPQVMHLMSFSFVNYRQNRSSVPLTSGLKSLLLQVGETNCSHGFLILRPILVRA